ncbi:MAG TPA: NHL repeat-containing protein [Candidatus Binatia bacterium]|nr:NHL repeat-containing protein [Candidatus Binatia bacterium]
MIRSRKLFGLFILFAALAIGGAFAGCGGGNSANIITGSTAIPFISGTIYISDPSKNQLVILAPSPGPNSIPASPITGSNTQLNGPQSMAFDGNHNLYVSNYNATTQASLITVFAVGAQNNQTPTLSISGSSTQLGRVFGIAVDSSLNMYVANCSNASTNCSTGTSSILIFAANATGNVAPTAVISGSTTGLSGPRGLGFDTAGNLWVANSGNASVTEYATPILPSAGNLTPKAVIIGSATGLKTPSDVILDGNTPSNLYVADSTANAIFVFPGTSNGNASPFHAIAGSSTALNAPSGVALAADGTLYVANTTNVLLFPSQSTGNIAPEATLSQTLSSVSDVELSI